MMHNGNEWYWNLNLHRNQSVLNNSMAMNSKKLPISSNLYTSAVLTDRGICVGMRNLNLKDANQSYSSKNQNIPHCCSNLNIVGQRNGQTWTAAYDQMRFSALTDPSMATQVDGHHFKYLQNNVEKWKDDDEEEDHEILPEDELIHENVSTIFNPSSSISAEFNPFHLFGDKSVTNELSQAFTVANISDKISNQMLNHTLGLIQHNHPIPYSNYNYSSEFDTNCNCIPLNFYSAHCCSETKSMPTSSLSSHLPCSMLKVARRSLHRRSDTNTSRSSHMVAPKKKWIQNYMRSNSHLYFLLSVIFLSLHFVYCLISTLSSIENIVIRELNRKYFNKVHK